MKTILSFVAAFLLIASTATAQDQKSTFENASLTKAADGAACVQLNWKKGAENTAYYLVERSNDGKEFKQVALVFTSEDANFVNYKFRDKGFASANGAAYYRICIVNDHNEITYLPAKKVDLSAGETL